MIHVLTVHWKDERWIDLQLAHCARIDEEFRVYTFLTDIDTKYKEKFYFASDEPIESHAVKLNILAALATQASRDHDNDLLLFLDGDAFPVADIARESRRLLTEYPLIAVQRRENNGDIQPHPCCCLTSVALWERIGGDWKAGYHWRNNSNELVTDVGGNLLEKLQAAQVEWYPLLRTNKKNFHPLFFGVYGNIVYHHGAGFRHPLSRADMVGISHRKRHRLATIVRKLPDSFGMWRLKRHFSGDAIVQDLVERNRLLSEEVFDRILHQPEFYREIVDFPKRN